MPDSNRTLSAEQIHLVEQGLGQLSNKKYKEVHAQCMELIQHDIRNAVPYLLLAQLTNDHGNYGKALELNQKAAEFAPQSAYCQTYYAQTLLQAGQQTMAKQVADVAAGLPVDSAHQADTLGVIYSRTGFHEKAVPWFKTAVQLDPRPANFHYNLGASLQFLGKFESAEKAYQATLKRDPASYRALASMVGLSKQTPENQHLESLRSLFDQLRSNADAALHLGHALAKTYEDLGRYQTSLEWLRKAKEQKRLVSSGLDYPKIFDAAKNTAKITRLNSENAPAQAPIFVIGLPRTGTTLVDRIISSHRDVVAAGELNTFADLIKRASKTPSNLTMDAATFTASHDVDLRAVGQQYIESLNDLRRNAPRVTDKMPLNFFYAALIHNAMPNARIIALRRGAMDSCLSNYRQLLTVQHSYYNYTYDLTSTADFYKQFDQLMAHWRANLPANRFTEVRYEDIVYDQENQTRRLLNFCGLDWDEACMRFHENKAPVSTASSVQVRQPLYSGSIGRWQRYGDRLDELKIALGDLAS